MEQEEYNSEEFDKIIAKYNRSTRAKFSAMDSATLSERAYKFGKNVAKDEMIVNMSEEDFIEHCRSQYYKMNKSHDDTMNDIYHDVDKVCKSYIWLQAYSFFNIELNRASANKWKENTEKINAYR